MNYVTLLNQSVCVFRIVMEHPARSECANFPELPGTKKSLCMSNSIKHEMVYDLPGVSARSHLVL